MDHTSNIRTDSTEHSVDVQNETDNSTSIDPLKASKEFEFRRANEGQLEREEEDEEEKKRCLDDLEAALMRGETSVKAFCLFYQLKTEIMNA